MRLGPLVAARGGLKSAGRAVCYLHAPWQLVLAGRHVVHVGVGAILRAALHRHIAPVVDLVHVVLYAPAAAGFSHQIGPDFGSDDLVHPASAFHHDGTVKVAEHAFAHRIKTAVAAAHAHAGGVGQVAKGVGLVGNFPRVADGRGVAGGAQDDLGPLVRRLARHLGKHAVVADDERNAAAVGPVTHRHAQVTRLPRLHWHPGVQLAVIELDGARVINDQAAVVGVAARVGLHDRKTAPDFVGKAGLLEGHHLRAIQRAHDGGINVHAKPVQ